MLRTPLAAALIDMCELAGTLLTFYGLLREAFADLAVEQPYGADRYGDDNYGGVPSPRQETLLRLGTLFRILPRDRSLTVSDRRRNAVLAVTGVFLYAIPALLTLVASWVRVCFGS